MESHNKCIFCKITNKVTTETDILYEDQKFVIFRDIRPAVEHHYLIVPKEHNDNVKALKSSDIEMITEMKNIGLEFISTKRGDTTDTLMGFHWPPFNSISHIHMHLISPASEMSFISRVIFKPGTWWFVTTDDFINWLSKR